MLTSEYLFQWSETFCILTVNVERGHVLPGTPPVDDRPVSQLLLDIKVKLDTGW